MKKLNKKGFTLVEMLVVIGIIAVLVAIVVPTVSSSTAKAAAATNAANLRSVLAEATTDYLAGVEDNKGYVSFNPTKDASEKFNPANAPAGKKVGGVDVGAIAIDFDADTEVITVTYGDFTINDFTIVAENGGQLKHVS